jgi:hypothetical protein
MISPEAFVLTAEVLRLQKLDPDDPKAIGTAYQLQAWLTKGWDGAAIRQGIATVMARIGAAPRSLRYFEPAIAQALAERDRPLPVVAAVDGNGHRLGRHHGTRVYGFLQVAEHFEAKARAGAYPGYPEFG